MKQEDQPTTKLSENTKKNTQTGQSNPRRIRRTNSGEITVIVGAPPAQS